MSLVNIFVDAFKKAAGKKPEVDAKEEARSSGLLGPTTEGAGGSFTPLRPAPTPDDGEQLGGELKVEGIAVAADPDAGGEITSVRSEVKDAHDRFANLEATDTGEAGEAAKGPILNDIVITKDIDRPSSSVERGIPEDHVPGSSVERGIPEDHVPGSSVERGIPEDHVPGSEAESGDPQEGGEILTGHKLGVAIGEHKIEGLGVARDSSDPEEGGEIFGGHKLGPDIGEHKLEGLGSRRGLQRPRGRRRDCPQGRTGPGIHSALRRGW